MRRMLLGHWLVIGMLLCGFTLADQPTIDQQIQDTVTIIVNGEEAVKASKGKYRQVLASPTKILEVSGLQDGKLAQYEVHEYVGPKGAGYTVFVRVQQATCEEHLADPLLAEAPCVWRLFRHEGPETWRDDGEGVWTLEPVAKPTTK